MAKPVLLHTAPTEHQAGLSSFAQPSITFCKTGTILHPAPLFPRNGAFSHPCFAIPFSAPSAHTPRPDTAVPVDSPASQCQPVAGPWGTLSCSQRHQPRDAHTDLLPHTEGICEPLLPQDPSSPASPHTASQCTIDKSLMSFALMSSQINTLHVAGVGWGGGVPQPLENPRHWERRGSKGRREDKAKGPDAKEVGEPSGKWLVEPILLQKFLQEFVSSCKDRVHYWLWVRLLGWRGQLQENGYFLFEVAGTITQGKEPRVNNQLLSV